MKQTIARTILYGLLIWVVPFIIAVLIWDAETNAPAVSFELFSAIMTFSWAIVYSIALIGYFKHTKKVTAQDAWKTGIIWYAVLIVFDLIFIVGMFGTSFAEYSPMLLTQSPTLILTGIIGKLLSQKK